MKNHHFLFLLLILIVQGCAGGAQFLVNVDSISSPESILKTNYILLSGIKDVDASDLQYREYAGYVDRVLTSLGYKQVSNITEADIAIFLAYGIGDPETRQYTTSIPVFGQVGIASSVTSGTINIYGDTGTYSGITTHRPRYGIAGYTERTRTKTSYSRYVELKAFDLEVYRTANRKELAWRTNVKSVGSSGDLREVFPIMIAASKDYIGKNTGKQIQVTLRESDERVIEVKGLKK